MAIRFRRTSWVNAASRGRAKLQGLDRLRNIVNSDDLRALLDGLKRQREAAGDALVGRRLVRQGADHSLAARADHDRVAKTMKQRKAVHQLEIVRDGLAEADSRIDQDFVTGNAGCFGSSDRSSSHR